MRLLARCGVARFVIEVVAPLNAAVGDAWMRGQMELFEEHARTQLPQTVLRQAIAAVPPGTEADRPHGLLTSFPNEPHGLGLLMAGALLCGWKAACVCRWPPRRRCGASCAPPPPTAATSWP